MAKEEMGQFSKADLKSEGSRCVWGKWANRMGSKELAHHQRKNQGEGECDHALPANLTSLYVPFPHRTLIITSTSD